MLSDVDQDGNSCAHICLMYDKQEVLATLVNISPVMCVTKNLEGLTSRDYSIKYQRTNKMRSTTIRKMNSMTSSSNKTEAY